MQLNTITKLCISTATITLLSACTGTEVMPNNATQTGAVAGALAGSVIGYNTGSNRGTNAAVGALVGTALGAGVGSLVDDQNPPPQQTGGWQ